MNLATYRERLTALPRSPCHMLGLPPSLSVYLSPVQRIPAFPQLPLPWIEYRLLAGLGLSGWSMRYALVEEEARQREVQVHSGTLRRACHRLSASGLWESATVRVAGRRTVLVRLTDLGRDLLAECGLTPVASEWEQMETLHRGDVQEQRLHTGAVCVFAHHARGFGHDTQICPQVDGPSEPDILLMGHDGTLYVEVQRRGGSVWQRAAKWCNLAALQGQAAICAETPLQAERFAQEARLAGVRRGRVTDLATLKQEGRTGLWTEEWGERVLS